MGPFWNAVKSSDFSERYAALDLRRFGLVSSRVKPPGKPRGFAGGFAEMRCQRSRVEHSPARTSRRRVDAQNLERKNGERDVRLSVRSGTQHHQPWRFLGIGDGLQPAEPHAAEHGLRNPAPGGSGSSLMGLGGTDHADAKTKGSLGSNASNPYSVRPG